MACTIEAELTSICRTSSRNSVSRSRTSKGSRGRADMFQSVRNWMPKGPTNGVGARIPGESGPERNSGTSLPGCRKSVAIWGTLRASTSNRHETPFGHPVNGEPTQRRPGLHHIPRPVRPTRRPPGPSHGAPGLLLIRRPPTRRQTSGSHCRNALDQPCVHL